MRFLDRVISADLAGEKQSLLTSASPPYARIGGQVLPFGAPTLFDGDATSDERNRVPLAEARPLSRRIVGEWKREW
jgi:hypothetical protein